MYHVPSALQCVYGHSDEGGGNGDGEESRVWRLIGLLYVDDLVLHGKPEEDLWAMVGCFVELCKRRGLKVNAVKRKVIWVGVETKRGKSLVRVEEMDEGHWCERR